MKAVVLAGGYATRLWPITQHRPKMFLPVGDMTIIDNIFEDLEDDDRVSEVFVSTNEYFEEEFQEYLDEKPYTKPTLSIEQTEEEDEKFGVVGALAQLFDREGVEDDVLVVAGDNLLGFDLAEFVDYFEEKDESVLAAYDVGSKERATSYGLVELSGDRVIGFQEKPEEPKSTLVSIACYAFPAAQLELFDDYLENDNNPDEPGWFIEWLQRRKPVHAYTFSGAWYDIGTPESYLDAVEWALGGESKVADNARIENSKIGDDVHVMSGAEVVDSAVERTVVFPNATVRDSMVFDSIVDEEAHVEGLEVEESLVGAHTFLKSRR